MSSPDAGDQGAALGCPKVTSFRNGASGTPLGTGLVADCLIAIIGENFTTITESFDPPVNEAFGIFACFPPEDRFPIYRLSPAEILCVVPGTIAAPQSYLFELHVPPQGPVPCPAVLLKGCIISADPGILTEDGSASGRGLFYTYPDGQAQPIPPGSPGQPMMVQVYGTGMRHARALPTAYIDGIHVTVIASEADTTRPGYDRLIFQLPHQGLLSGPHRFRIMADGRASNEVEIELL
jgi:hypothetical protein